MYSTEELIDTIREMELKAQNQTYLALTAAYCSEDMEPWSSVVALIPIDIGDPEVPLEVLYEIEGHIDRCISSDVEDGFNEWKCEEENEDKDIDDYIRNYVTKMGGRDRDSVRRCVEQAIQYFKKYRKGSAKAGSAIQVMWWKDEYWGG